MFNALFRLFTKALERHVKNDNENECEVLFTVSIIAINKN